MSAEHEKSHSDCLFCKIISGDIPSRKVYETDDVLAFWDINPFCPVHVLIIPKKHVDNVAALGNSDEDTLLAGKIVIAAKKIAEEMGITSSGYRIVSNIGEDGRQTVYHMHFHLLGGEKLTNKLG